MISLAVALLILTIGIVTGVAVRQLAVEFRSARAQYAALILGVGTLHQTR